MIKASSWSADEVLWWGESAVWPWVRQNRTGRLLGRCTETSRVFDFKGMRWKMRPCQRGAKGRLYTVYQFLKAKCFNVGVQKETEQEFRARFISRCKRKVFSLHAVCHSDSVHSWQLKIRRSTGVSRFQTRGWQNRGRSMPWAGHLYSCTFTGYFICPLQIRKCK